MKEKESNEFTKLINDGYYVVTHPEEEEKGIAYAFTPEQVQAILKKLLAYFDVQSIIVSIDDDVHTISLCDRIKPIAKKIIQKVKLLNQFGLNNNHNKKLLCNATSENQLDRICRDIFINW